MNLLNRFIITGSLSEARVDLYPSHLKAKLAINVNNFIIVCSGTISRRFKPEQYDEFLDLIQYLHPEADGIVYVNREQYYTLTSNIRTKLLISGSLFPTDSQLFFNFRYCQTCNNSIQDNIDIALKGQFISNQQLLNVTFDSPKVFEVERPNECRNNTIYQLKCQYNPNYHVENDIVYSYENMNNIQVIDCIDTGNSISQSNIKQYMREWNMINQ